MVFSSAIFLFAFLPLSIIIYRLMRSMTAKNIFLTVISIIFYGFGEPKYVLVLLLSVLCNYTAGRLIERFQNRKKLWLAAAIVFNLGLLCYFKYLGFAAENISLLLATELEVPDIVLPIGISFFTFQGLSYIIDVYRGEEKAARSLLKIALYISLFPQLIAGPIVKYHDVSKQIESRTCTHEKTALGLRRFIAGLAKKLLIANSMGQIADSLFAVQSPDMVLSWIAALAYMLQIYFDFSGYSDMAIGLGSIFGFRFKENFNYPYTALSLQDFWRRWHISLSGWFRDYLYIPLGGNRGTKRRAEFNKFIVFLMTGLWHGASWSFVIWGLWHFLFVFLEDMKIIPARRLSHGKSRIGHAVSRIYTLIVVCLGFVIFRAETLGGAIEIITGMLSFSFDPSNAVLVAELITPAAIAVFIIGTIAAAGLLPYLKRRLQSFATPERREVYSYALTTGLFVLCVLELSSAEFNPFIYFRF